MNKHKQEYGRVKVPPDIVSRASEGDAAAQLILGKSYFDATLVENNHHRAFKWIYRSAQQGNMEAQFRLGDLYALGYGAAKHFPDAYKWYTKAAIQGYKKALIRIHNLYQGDVKIQCRGRINSEEGDWQAHYRIQERKVVSNFAIDYYSDQFNYYRSSNQEDPIVQLNLAFLYQHGYGVKKSIRWAFEYYAKAAEQGNRDAQYNLGNLYQKHTDIKFNYRQAFKWYTESAQGGNIAAQKSLAYFYLKGLATDIDYETALSWYTKAAEAGDSEAQVILGKLYRKGDCVEQDIAMSVEWYRLAARQGSIVAQNCLSQLHQRGMLDGIELEEDMVEYLSEDSMNSRLCTKLSLDVSKLGDSPRFKQLNELARCALIGDGRAMYEIGLKYLKGDSDFTQDQDTGAKWIKNAANAKYKHAQSMIAYLYKKGDSIEQDYCKVAIWYNALAKQKNPDAQCNVGIMYNEGLGVRKDPLEASKWFTWAADQGNSDGQYNLGMLRLKGRGIRQDEKEAVNWFLKSAHQRNSQACHKLSDMYFFGHYQIEVNKKRSWGLLKYAANNGIEDAQYRLGRYYGSIREEYYDLSQAILYYTMAADSGKQHAQRRFAIKYLNENDIDRDCIKMYNLFKQARDRGYEYFDHFFETPIQPSYGVDYSNILNMFIEVSKNGLDNLHYNIGFWYEHGLHIDMEYVLDINYASAAEWYLAASDNGDSRADYRLGIMHENGKHFEKNIHTAISYYNKASLQGDTDAIYRFGSIYANGYGVSQDLLKAFHLYTKAFSMGNKDASDELKIERSYGSEDFDRSGQSNTNPRIPVNRATRISMLEKATEEGFTGLQYQLGVMYERENNHQKAFKWFSLAAEIEVTDAYCRLGTLYEEGRGVEQDYTTAAEMYQKATEREHEDACYKLGRLYQYANGVSLDYLESYRFYKKAADMGHVKACKILSIPLDAGLNSNEDTDLSSQEWQDSLLLRKYVAEHGDTEVQFKVGFDYEHGGLESNYVEAYKWYSMAAKSSHQKALYHLGLLYEKGFGVSQDYHEAIRLYDQANQQNNDDVLYRLGVAYHYGKGVEVDLKKAVGYYKYAAEQGKPEYQCQLGKLYDEGELVEKDLLEALKWYTKAYLQGYDTIRPKLFTMYEHKPYEDYFFEKLVQNLSIASCGYFRLNEYYPYYAYSKINGRLAALYLIGLGANKDIEEAWKYLTKKYSSRLLLETEIFLFLIDDTLSSSEKEYILKTIEQDEAIVRQMDGNYLYALGMHFFYGVKKVFNIYITFTSRHRGLEYSNQEIVIEKNCMKAYKYLKKAADNNHPDALLYLGIMYHCGYGVEKNLEQGEKCFDSLIKIDRNYMVHIANLYLTHGEMQNFDKAFEWYTLLEKRLYKDFGKIDQFEIKIYPQLGMGLLYEFGCGVKQNYQKAFGCYKKLADDNIAPGLHRLALMYYYGNGVPVDYKEASNLFAKSQFGKSASDLPFVRYQTGLDTNGLQKNLTFCLVDDQELEGENCYYLGLMQRYGQGVLQDEEKARDYFKLAVRFGCKRTKYEL